MSGSDLYREFDDRNPAFTYSPGWSTLTDTNAHESTLSYTSKATNATVQFYGNAVWLFGAIGKTADWNQPVSRYTLDKQYISVMTAGVKNETSYNELFAHFFNLDTSYHTLLVENLNGGATLFLDYYLVERVPPGESTKPTGNLQTGGIPVSTSILGLPTSIERTDPSGKVTTGSIVGAVIGGILLLILIAIAAFILWRKRGGSKQYHYRRAAVREVLFQELTPSGGESNRESMSPPSAADDTPQNTPRSPPTPTRTLRHVMSQSSMYTLNSDQNPPILSTRRTYFPMPSEYQSPQEGRPLL